MRLQQLRAKAAQHAAKMKAIAAIANTQALTAEQTAEFEAEKAAHAATLAEIQTLEAMNATAAAAMPATTDADAAAAARAAANVGATRVEFGQAGHERDPKGGFATARQFLSAVMVANRGGRVDERLQRFRSAAGSDEHGEYSAPNGGFLVPVGLSGTILLTDPEDPTNEMRTRQVPLEAPQVKFNARVDKNHTTSVSGGLTVTRRPETVAATSSRQAYEQVAMNASSLFGLAFATEELLSDSPGSFAALLEQGFRAEFASKLTDERINGGGVGEFLGAFNAANPSLIAVDIEVGQAADTIDYENLKKMRARVWGYGQAVWHANHDCLPQLMGLVQVIGTGGVAVYQPSARDGEPDRLLGRPIYYTEYTNTIGDQGDIICANWNEYLEGTLQNIQSGESVHVRFVEHERTFKFWMRNDGRPWWLSVLTPKKSAVTMSPFVTLKAR